MLNLIHVLFKSAKNYSFATNLTRNLKQEWKKLSINEIRKIFAAAPYWLKAIAEKEGHHVEWLLIFLIPMNIGNNYCYQWISIKCTIFCLQWLFRGGHYFFVTLYTILNAFLARSIPALKANNSHKSC